MTKVSNLHKKWLDNPGYIAAYDEMGEEFSAASVIIEARNRAGLTRKQLAERMDAEQSLIARHESGAQNTTIKTLQKVAAATGTHLKISYEDSDIIH